MEYITFDEVSIEGINYQRIIDLQIEQKIDEHATAVLVLEMDENITKENMFSNRILKIHCNFEGKKDLIFCGVVVHDVHVEEADYSATRIELVSMSLLLDLKPVTATYQKSSTSYQQLMEMVAKKQAVIYFGITDSMIGSWRYRNSETSWAFIKRLASQLNAHVFTNMSTEVPTISIGKTDRFLSDELELIETYRLDERIVYRTNRVLEIGMRAYSDNYIMYAKTYFNGAILITDYVLGKLDEMKQETYYNSQSECRMLTGVVQAVEKEKVKVFFDSIDDSFDEGGDSWFEYATPFATNGGEFGSGFYFMPEKGDRVRVFLPSANEGSAFAFGTISESGISNHEHVQWKVPGGQEILFTNEGIRISCNDQKVYIDMKSSGGINVWSDSDISMERTEEIVLNGDNGVIMHADNCVILSASEAFMIMENDKIVFNSVYFQMGKANEASVGVSHNPIFDTGGGGGHSF